MAKDILKFHAVIWPALCMAAGLEPPRRMVIHGFLLMGEKKMSKSLGNVLDPFVVIERFGADALRFYLFREVSFGQDGSISTAGFEARYETELANDYGNLASRVLAMVDRYRDGAVPRGAGRRGAAEDFEGALARLTELLDRAELSQALEVIWVLVRRLNRYVEETAPWVLAKDEADPARLDEVLYNLVEGLRVVTLMLVPYLPATAETLLAALGEEGRGLAELGSRGGGQQVERIPPLFPKIETSRPSLPKEPAKGPSAQKLMLRAAARGAKVPRMGVGISGSRIGALALALLAAAALCVAAIAGEASGAWSARTARSTPVTRRRGSARARCGWSPRRASASKGEKKVSWSAAGPAGENGQSGENGVGGEGGAGGEKGATATPGPRTTGPVADQQSHPAGIGAERDHQHRPHRGARANCRASRRRSCRKRSPRSPM